MDETILLTQSDHICRLASSIIGAVIIGFCGIVLFFQACRWINKALDNRQYRLETDRRVKIEQLRWYAMAEKEGWRSYDEYLATALAGYAKENYQMREFMKKCKVADLYERRKSDDEGTADVVE